MPGQNTLRLKRKDEALHQQQVVEARRSREAEAHSIAKRAADADTSDPFTYARTFSRVMGRVGDEYAFAKPRENAEAA